MFVLNRLRFLSILKSYLYYARFFNVHSARFLILTYAAKQIYHSFQIKQIPRPGHQGPPHLKMAITIQIKRFSRRKKKRLFLLIFFYSATFFPLKRNNCAIRDATRSATWRKTSHDDIRKPGKRRPAIRPSPAERKKRPEPVRLRALDAPGKGIPYSVLTENSAMEGASPEASAHASKRSTRPRCGANSTSCSTGLFTMFENSPSATLRPSSNSR